MPKKQAGVDPNVLAAEASSNEATHSPLEDALSNRFKGTGIPNRLHNAQSISFAIYAGTHEQETMRRLIASCLNNDLSRCGLFDELLR